MKKILHAILTNKNKIYIFDIVYYMISNKRKMLEQTNQFAFSLVKCYIS
jgi:hypothetical protein